MRRFANFYIIMFLFDAGLSLVDEMLAVYGSSSPLFTNGRLLVAFAVIALSVVVYACLGIDRRLPKLVFLPMTLYITWCSVAMWPLSCRFAGSVVALSSLFSASPCFRRGASAFDCSLNSGRPGATRLTVTCSAPNAMP